MFNPLSIFVNLTLYIFQFDPFERALREDSSHAANAPIRLYRGFSIKTSFAPVRELK